MRFRSKPLKLDKRNEYVVHGDTQLSRHSKHSPNIKKVVGDFIVKEIMKLNGRKGDYLYLELTKTDRNTMDVVKELAYKLRIPLKFIGFAGNKDKRAITTQYISIYNGNPDKIRELNIENVEIKILHFGSQPIYFGAAKGNYFKIKFETEKKIIKVGKVANYYGEQRFSENNKEIGQAILQGEYQKACELINSPQIKSYLYNHPEEYRDALRTIQKDLLQLYINAFQSYLWNEVAKQFIKDNFQNTVEKDELLFVENPKNNIDIPLISFDTFIKQKNLRTYYNNLLRKENVSQEDYYLKDFPELIQGTVERSLFVEVRNFKQSKDYLEFTLPPGSFGTIVVKHIEAILNRF